METETMGIVLVTALIENYDDVKTAEKGIIPEADVRCIEVNDARVQHRGDLRLDAATSHRATGP